MKNAIPLVYSPDRKRWMTMRLRVEFYSKYIELWNLGDDFKKWFEEACGVYATLVDRIVPGFPRKEIAEIQEKISYRDNLVVQAENFHLWVIEAPKEVAEEFPADKAGLHVLFVPSEEPYHKRKVTLLNGPHTVLSPVAFLSGVNIVRDACNHEVIGKYIHKVQFEELMQTLDLPMDELEKFAGDVLERFDNPYVDHQVTSIMLNSFPKFQARDLPGVKTFLERKGELPKGLVFGLAAIITYYKGGVEFYSNNSSTCLRFSYRTHPPLWSSISTSPACKSRNNLDFIASLRDVSLTLISEYGEKGQGSAPP